MKIAYIIEGVFNSGGMERVLSRKSNYLVNQGYDITIITTDQKQRASFFQFSDKIKFYDLGVNYYDLVGSGLLSGFFGLLKKNKLCKQKLTELLLEQRFDIVISMFGNDAAILHGINDGSKKILEFHLSRYYRLQKGKSGLRKVLEQIRVIKDKQIAKKYSKFVVLTSEDAKDWGSIPNMVAIPNPTSFFPVVSSKLNAKSVIAVGRLTAEKGYDKMVQAWEKVAQKHPDWTLNIFGEGELKNDIQDMIIQRNLQNNIILNAPTQHIEYEFLRSSIFLITSKYEGFGLVILEAMSCGVPPVAFACKCGPLELITNEVDGLLTNIGDTTALSDAICRLIEDDDLRNSFGDQARKTVENRFSEKVIMKQWVSLFNSSL